MPSLACAAAPGLNPPVRLLLEIVVNGQDTGNVGRFYQSGDALLAPRGELASLGLILPPDSDENSLVALGSLKNVTYWINQASQTLMIVATAGGIEPTQLNGRGESAEALPVETGTGTLLNYDVLANSQLGGDSAYGPRNVVSGLFDARIFSPAGILDSSLIAGNADTGSSQAVIRLNTTYSYAEPDQLRLYQLGDFISGSLSWSRAARSLASSTRCAARRTSMSCSWARRANSPSRSMSSDLRWASRFWARISICVRCSISLRIRRRVSMVSVNWVRPSASKALELSKNSRWV